MRTLILVAIVQAIACMPLQGADANPLNNSDDPAHDELRALREQVVDAYEQRDVDQLLKHVHPNAVITWQNAERNRGSTGLRDFYKKMMEGENRVVESLTSKVSVEDLSVIHGGDTAIAFGSVDDEYRLTDGRDFSLTSRWSATLVKEEDQWLIANFHISSNIFDNPILDAMKSYLVTVGIVAALIGLLVGVVVVKLLSRSRKPAA